MTKMEDIRGAYPNPKTSFDATREKDFTTIYCVGGAVCNYIYMPTATRDSFPNPIEIARALQEINPRLPDYEAQVYAMSVVTFNDKGNFDTAWKCVDRALNFDQD